MKKVDPWIRISKRGYKMVLWFKRGLKGVRIHVCMHIHVLIFCDFSSFSVWKRVQHFWPQTHSSFSQELKNLVRFALHGIPRLVVSHFWITAGDTLLAGGRANVSITPRFWSLWNCLESCWRLLVFMPNTGIRAAVEHLSTSLSEVNYLSSHPSVIASQQLPP